MQTPDSHPFLVIWWGVVLKKGGDAWERLTFGMFTWELKHLLISIAKILHSVYF